MVIILDVKISRVALVVATVAGVVFRVVTGVVALLFRFRRRLQIHPTAPLFQNGQEREENEKNKT
jgi:hypothetical protein